MPQAPHDPQRVDLSVRALWPFLLIAFGLAWGLVVVLLAFPGPVTAIFGPISGTNPLFILAVYAPAIAAVVLVLGHGGWNGLGRFLSRLALWRGPAGWYAFVIVGVPVLFYAGAWAKGTPLAEAFPSGGLRPLLAALAMTAIIGPMEEFGWRGLALPLLQRRMAPIWAGIVLGIIWGVWHLPAFYLGGTPQSAWSFMPFFLAAVAVSVIATAMFNDFRGSILLPAILHYQLNNPIFPDAHPNDTAMFVGAAVIVVALRWRSLTRRDHAVTAVIPTA